VAKQRSDSGKPKRTISRVAPLRRIEKVPRHDGGDLDAMYGHTTQILDSTATTRTANRGGAAAMLDR
jgi:hypothetical protein